MADSEMRVLRGVEAVIMRPDIFTLRQSLEEVIAYCVGYKAGAGYEPHDPDAAALVTAFMDWLRELAWEKRSVSDTEFGDAVRQVFGTDEEFFDASRKFLVEYRARRGSRGR